MLFFPEKNLKMRYFQKSNYLLLQNEKEE